MMLNCDVSLGKRQLGRTGILVSEVSFGTVELGMDYGIGIPGNYGKPSRDDSISLLQHAADAGITLFDTAPGYGNSEYLLGQGLGKDRRCLFATKVPVPRDAMGKLLRGEAGKRQIDQSLARSLKALNRDALDIVQIHNATVEVLKSSDLLPLLHRAKQCGLIRCIGASVYQEEEAFAAIQSGICDVLQVPYNVLDQRMAQKIFSAAEEAGVGLIGRSAFLKGVLTSKAQWLPPNMHNLQRLAEQVKTSLAGSWEALSHTALQFCLSSQALATVLVGIRTEDELREALVGYEHGLMNSSQLAVAATLATHDDALLNPSRWVGV